MGTLHALVALAVVLATESLLKPVPTRKPARALATPKPVEATVDPGPLHSVSAELEALIQRARMVGSIVSSDGEGEDPALDLKRALDLFARDLAGLDRRSALHLLAAQLLCQDGERDHARFHLEQAFSYRPDQPRLEKAVSEALADRCWELAPDQQRSWLAEMPGASSCVAADPIWLPAPALTAGDVASLAELLAVTGLDARPCEEKPSKRARRERGENEATQPRHGDPLCAVPLAVRDLEAGRPFDAWLRLASGNVSEDSRVASAVVGAEALAQLGHACLALRRLGSSLEDCAEAVAEAAACSVGRRRLTELESRCREASSGGEGDFPGLAARLGLPRQRGYQRGRLRPAEAREQPSAAPDEEAVAAHPALRGREVVLLDSVGPRRLAVSLSSALDPVGQGSRGGYWAQLSADSGESWSAPLYLGIAEGGAAGLRVRSRSRVPPFAGDAIRVEIDDPDRRGGDAPVYLHFPLETIERDTDGDGLTDLVEDRIASDPASSDTDADGIPDAEDALPLSSSSGDDSDDGAGGAGSAADAVLAKLLGSELFAGAAPRFEGRVSGGIEAMACDPSRLGNAAGTAQLATLYYSAGRSRFAGYRLARRLVLVPPSLAAAWRARYGVALEGLPEVVLDPSGTQAWLEWVLGHYGGSARLRRLAGDWQVASRTSVLR